MDVAATSKLCGSSPPLLKRARNYEPDSPPPLGTDGKSSPLTNNKITPKRASSVITNMSQGPPNATGFCVNPDLCETPWKTQEETVYSSVKGEG